MPTIRFEFYGQHELSLPEGDIYRTVAREILTGESYPFLANDPHPVRSVIDLGAHVGEWTIMAAARWPEATVHAFEPNPQVLDLLKQNCRPFSNVVVHEQAAGPRAERTKLFVNNRNSVQAMMPRPENCEAGVEWQEIDIDVVGPQTLLELAPDVLKIDIEGMEGLVLRSLSDGLAQIAVVHVEYHLEQLRLEIEALLSPTHQLKHRRQGSKDHGEMMYVRQP